jgi:ATP-dependent DNA ligase
VFSERQRLQCPLSYPGVVAAFSGLPDDTAIDGEVVALDSDGKPSLNMLKNYGPAGAPVHFFVFDLHMLNGKNLMAESLVKTARTATQTLACDPRARSHRIRLMAGFVAVMPGVASSISQIFSKVGSLLSCIYPR